MLACAVVNVKKLINNTVIGNDLECEIVKASRER